MANLKKPMVLMLVDQDPYLDPRLRWEAETLSGSADVFILGFDEGRARSSLDQYATVYRHKVSKMKWHFLYGLGFGFRTIFESLNFANVAYLITRLPILVGWLLFGCLFFALKKMHLTNDKKRFTLIYDISRQYNLVWTCLVASNRLRFALKKANVNIQDIQVIHCHDLTTLCLGVFLKSRVNAKLVYDSHEFWPHIFPKGPGGLSLIVELFEGYLIRQVDLVLAVNEFIAGAISKLYNISYVISLPNCEPYKLEYANVASQNSAARIVFLYQGGAAPGRGLEFLVKNWSKLTNKNLILYIRSPKCTYRDHLISLAEQLSLLNRTVEFPEPVSEDQLVESATVADVGLIPYEDICLNHKYCCPNKLSQYMCAGLPILSNKLAFIEKIILESDAGIVYSGERDFLAAVEKLGESKAERDRLGRNSSVYAKQEYNWQIQSRAFFDRYKNNLLLN